MSLRTDIENAIGDALDTMHLADVIRLADALMPIVREEKERAARECMEQAVHIAFTGRLPDFDDIVRRVCGE